MLPSTPKSAVNNTEALPALSLVMPWGGEITVSHGTEAPVPKVDKEHALGCTQPVYRSTARRC